MFDGFVNVKKKRWVQDDSNNEKILKYAVNAHYCIDALGVNANFIMVNHNFVVQVSIISWNVLNHYNYKSLFQRLNIITFIDLPTSE